MHLDTGTTQLHKPPKRIVIATTNSGKLREFRDLLGPLGISLATLDAFAAAAPVEDGATFEDNARIKASGYAKQVGEWVIADDSGLEIAALDGAPGVHSARFAGDDSSYAEKMNALLEMMAGVDKSGRDARFVCVIALASPDGSIRLIAEGECSGSITHEPRGSSGFGYDPIFLADGHARTFGELTDREKASVSHRSRAAAEFIRQMLDFISV